ncbi:MAG: hypothetical protein NC483_07310 [Ruminococcus sp.]|nr:hypothetical protein [Ruminococcus sp.]
MIEKINKYREKIPKWFKYALPIFIIFTVVLLAYYPGILVSDSMVQWNETQTRVFSDWHPAYNTIYIFLLTLIWNNPFFVLLVQCFILSASIGLFFSKLEEYYHVNKIFLVIVSVLFAIIPLNFNSAVILLKDTIYSSFIILLAAEFVSLVNNKEYLTKKNIIKIGIFLLAIALFRHNGILVVLLSLITLIVFYHRKSVYILTASVLITYVLMTTVGFKILHIEGGNAANTYGPVSHFLAKLLNESDNNFTEKELEELSLYVDVPKLKETFNQYNMDNSINAQNIDYIKEHNVDYLKFALKKIKSNFKSFIDYYLKLDSFLYAIHPFEGQYTVGMFYETDLWLYKDVYPELEENSKIPSLLPKLKNWTNEYQYNHFDGLAMRPAFYMYASIVMIIILSIWTKNKLLFIVILPSLFNILSLTISMPVAMTRYVYSMMLTFYAVLPLFIYELFIYLKKLLKERMIKND